MFKPCNGCFEALAVSSDATLNLHLTCVAHETAEFYTLDRQSEQNVVYWGQVSSRVMILLCQDQH